MRDSEFFQLPSPPCYSNNIQASIEHDCSYFEPAMDANIHHFEFSPPITATDSTSNELVDFPVDSDSMNIDEYSPLDFEELELIWRDQIENQNGLSKGLEEICSFQPYSSEGKLTTDKCSPSPSTISSADAISTMDASLIQQPLTLPTGDMEIDNQLSVHHLAKAYKEAMENKEAELAGVIMRRISKKVSPTGETAERLLYYLFRPLDKETDYLMQESAMNFDRALEAFYKIFPDGMISHFTANSVILEAKPRDAEVLHIIDFDMGEGMQWSSMIMILGQKQKELQAQPYHVHIPHYTTLKLTAIKWKEEDSGHHLPSWRRFEETKRRLHDGAKSFGLTLEVEEVELQNLVSKIQGKTGGERREWLAFNCMWALPHMGRMRGRRHVLDFVRTAKEILANNSVYSNTSNGGILTFGDGGAWELFKDCPGFGFFFDNCMEHCQALLESIEWKFPSCFMEARITMECLFVAPYVSSRAWIQDWEEIDQGCDFKTGFGLQGSRLSNESLLEAKEMVREGETPYAVRIEGENYNEMVLEFRGTQLIKFSAWKS